MLHKKVINKIFINIIRQILIVIWEEMSEQSGNFAQDFYIKEGVSQFSRERERYRDTVLAGALRQGHDTERENERLRIENLTLKA